jgi:hypothetical protein
MKHSTHSYPKILSVIPLEKYQLRVTFTNHITKVYDCSDILKHHRFSVLYDPAFFRAVHVDQGGYGVFWNDDLDLSESELWLHGKSLDEQDEAFPNNQTAGMIEQHLPS